MTIEHPRHNKRHLLWWLSVFTVLCTAGSCRLPDGADPRNTQIERLVQAYPELQAGRFAIIADFESPEHMQLFETIAVSPNATLRRENRKGRSATGRGCLMWTTQDPGDTLVINNRSAVDWSLKSDWRAFDLLMMSVNVPREGLRLNVAIIAGRGEERAATESTVELQTGWNVVRCNLAEVGERIPLDDVQEVHLSIAGTNRAVDVLFDDLLLTTDRETLLTGGESRDGELFVDRVAGRYIVGAAGRFVLVFAHGQIVAWYDLAADPHRIVNLVQGSVLGPEPVADDRSATEPRVTGFDVSGEQRAARHWIEEASAVRVVVGGERWLVTGGADGAPRQRWRYVVYPTGQMYVAMDFGDAASAPTSGLMISFASNYPYAVDTHNQPADDADSSATAYATARGRAPEDPSLLWIVDDPDSTLRIDYDLDAAARRHVLRATGRRENQATAPWQCQLLLARSGDVSDESAAARAVEYAHPTNPTMQIGMVVSTSPAAHPGDSFDPGDGCYRLRPSAGRLRFVIDGRTVHAPAFRVVDAPQGRAWVYVNHRIHPSIARTTNGDLIFQLPERVADRTMVDVLFRRTADGS